MQSMPTPEQYISELHEDPEKAIIKLRETVLRNIPEDFEEQMSYGMLEDRFKKIRTDPV